MPRPWDAIVVGARCAGSPTAMLLARKGYRVLLADRVTFPSDTVSTHFLWQPAVAALRDWDLLDAVDAAGTPPQRSTIMGIDAVEFECPVLEHRGVDVCYSVRRTILDAILVEAAAASGVEVRQGFGITALEFDGDRVIGVRGRQHGGDEVSERATIVIGADGRRSTVADLVGAERYDDRGPTTCCYYAYYSGLAHAPNKLWQRGEFGGAMNHTNDGLTLIGMNWRVGRADEVRADIEGAFHDGVRHDPEVADLVAAGQRETRFTGTRSQDNHFRRSHGPGWALVGDAGYQKDAITAQGISDAFRDAASLADAVDAGLAGREPLDDALATYQRDRDEFVRPHFDYTVGVAALTPLGPPWPQFFEALGEQPEQASRFLGVFGQVVSPQEFFTSELVTRMLA